MTAILVTLSLFVWAVLAFAALPERIEIFSLPTWRPSNPVLMMLAVLLGALGFYVRYHFPNPEEIHNWFWSFVIDLTPEMVGMAFTIVVIDELNQRRLDQQEKERLFAQIKSPVRDIAVEALRLIKENNWLSQVLEKYDYDFAGSQWERADLQEAHLQEISLWDANLQCTNLMGSNLHRADLLRANLQKAVLAGASLQGAYLKEANLYAAVLVGANLQEAVLEGANLIEANLFGVYLMEANLRGAVLIGANLQKANLLKATYSENTVWPQDFAPSAMGAILVGHDDD